MDSRFGTEDGTIAAESEQREQRPVSFKKIEADVNLAADASAEPEEFEIEIGSWRARIVRQEGGASGRQRLVARFDAAPKEVWMRRRIRRLADRLNARRRSADFH